MTEPEVRLIELLRAFRRRIIILFTEQMICRGLLGAASLAVVLIIIDDLTVWYITSLGLCVVFGIGMLAGMAWAYFHSPSMQDIAFTIERKQPMLNRVSTAIVLANNPANDAEYRALITEDAIMHLAQFTPKQLFAHRLTRAHKLAGAGWGLVILLCLLPSIPWLHSGAYRQERAQVHTAGDQLTRLADSLQKHPELKKYLPQIREMKKLGDVMSRNLIPKKEALKQLNRLQDELNNLEKTEEQSSASSGQNSSANGQSGNDNRKTGPSATQESLEEAQDSLESARLAMNNDGTEMASSTASQTTSGTSNSNNQNSANNTGNHAGNNNANGSQNGNNNSGNNTGNQSGNQTGNQSGNQAGNQSGNQTGNQGGNQPRNQAGNQGGNQGNNGGNGQNGNQRSGNGQGSNGAGYDGKRPGSYAPNGTPLSGGQGGGNWNARPGPSMSSQQQERLSGSGMSLMIPGRGPDGTNQAGSAVPYYQVYGDYRKRAEHALDREQIPPESRQRVKAYFDALDPASGK